MISFAEKKPSSGNTSDRDPKSDPISQREIIKMAEEAPKVEIIPIGEEAGKCSKCGSDIIPDSHFCPTCRATFLTKEQIEKMKEQVEREK